MSIKAIFMNQVVWILIPLIISVFISAKAKAFVPIIDAILEPNKELKGMRVIELLVYSILVIGLFLLLAKVNTQ